MKDKVHGMERPDGMRLRHMRDKKGLWTGDHC